MQSRLAQKVHLPEGYHLEWAGEYESLQKEQRRLAVIIPIRLLIILALLFTAFNSFRHALLVLAILPFGLIGGILSLLVDSHALQHLRRGWVCVGDRSVHARRRRVCFWHSPEESGSHSLRATIELGIPGRDAASRDGVRRGGLRLASCGSFDGHRRPGSATACPRGRWRNDYFAAGHPVPDTRSSPVTGCHPRMKPPMMVQRENSGFLSVLPQKNSEATPRPPPPTLRW